MINNMKMGVKLAGVFAIIFVVVTAMMLSGAAVRMKALRMLDSNYRDYVNDIKNIGTIEVGLVNMEKDLHLYVNSPAARENALIQIQEGITSTENSFQSLKSSKRDSEEQKYLSEFEVAWPEIQRGYKAVIKAVDEGKNDDANSILADKSYLNEAGRKALAVVKNLNQYSVNKNETRVKQYVKGRGGWSGILWIFSGFGALALIGLGTMVHRNITRPIKTIVLMMQEIEKGHLSKRLKMNRKDEIGSLSRSMDMFADNLQKNIVYSMQQISEGNIDVEPKVTDSKDEIGPALIKMINAIGSMSNEVKRCCLNALEGNLQNRADVTPYQGSFRQIIQAFNDTLDAVMNPINEAALVLTKVADKDMTARMAGDYKGGHAKIKESVNMVVDNLDGALQQVAISADQVASASVQVSTGGQSLSQGASEQASSLEEISSSLQEMSSMTKQNTLNAREAKGVAEQARGSAERGVESMSRMSSAINQIKSSSDATSKIVKTIDEIAFQTNLLALNAAVEAARAGDAGRGFAVVAEEVRNLAMRSAEAAKNTASLIEEAVRNSENGVTINTEVLTNFQEITEKINKVSQVVAEIAAASEQQDQGINQVNKAVEQMNQLTQQNAANAEESASAAEEMSSQSEEMRAMVAGFRLTKTVALTAGPDAIKKTEYRLPDVAPGKKGDKASAGLHPDPRKVIPLDDKDHDILQNF
ncbi:MAG TPA: methyl-accepting chemotaxis protein [Smithella sp.]|nr:methyl-accepting chemotaxis protein [Smithella sp.]HOS13594.1 methyl-accepting chemotaxis protein [Smithella sp.]HOX97892.1 methyl-accepting chemotaxis protein [Smithella sp.]HPN86427.1 methyl-accepting chemotaxis protein [Smithella sp.]